jgi:hypothetical protein
MQEQNTKKELTPQELQQQIYAKNLKNKISDATAVEHNAKACTNEEVDPSITAVVEAIKAGKPFVVLLDDGKQVTLSSSQLSQPAILGLFVKFIYQLTTQDVNYE